MGEEEHWVNEVRLCTGIAALILTLVVFVTTSMRYSEYASVASAIQIIQILSEAIFTEVVIIGGALAIYIFTRFRK